MSTQSREYANRLIRLESVWWKRLLPVQAPYQWNLRRQSLGRTLDIGCGVGRNLHSLAADSVGVDHNATSVSVARSRGFTAYTVEEFLASADAVPERFDGLLIAHVVEHMSEEASRDLLGSYLRYLKPGGRLFLVCPQEKGYASDPTHETFTSGESLERLATWCDLEPTPWRSFPLPRTAGRWFRHNEFTVLATKPG